MIKMYSDGSSPSAHHMCKYGRDHHNAKSLTWELFYKQNSNIKLHVAILAIFLSIMKPSILTETKVVASYIYIVIQLANVCQKCVICQTKTAWGCKKRAQPSKVESNVQFIIMISKNKEWYQVAAKWIGITIISIKTTGKGLISVCSQVNAVLRTCHICNQLNIKHRTNTDASIIKLSLAAF